MVERPQPASRRFELQYSGIASDLMELNQPIADQYMRVTDTRRDILVQKMSHKDALNYDQVGWVRVTKGFLDPSSGEQRDKVVTVEKKDGAWLLGINDQKIAQQVTQQIETQKIPRAEFDAKFIAAFQQAMVSGVTNTLIKEKILNSLELDLPSAVGYWAFVSNTTDLLAKFTELYVKYSPDLEGVIIGLTVGTGIVLASNFTTNGALLGVAKFLNNNHPHGLFEKGDFVFKGVPNEDDPMVRHLGWGLLLPSVPVDRLIRGSWYLHRHGDEFIK